MNTQHYSRPIGLPDKRIPRDHKNEVSTDLPYDCLTPICARRANVESLKNLLEAHIPLIARETVMQLPTTWPLFKIVRTSTGRVVGAGSLQPIDHAHAEIRGLAVSREWRQFGIASSILNVLVALAAERGIQCTCVTQQPKFFVKFGFEETSTNPGDAAPGDRCPYCETRVTMLLANPPARCVALS